MLEFEGTFHLGFFFGSPVIMLDVHAGDAAGLADDLLKYSNQLTFEQTKIMTKNTWQVDVFPLFAHANLTGSATQKAILLRLKIRTFI
jgi:hypothetical protein